jgi:hypothetical protein
VKISKQMLSGRIPAEHGRNFLSLVTDGHKTCSTIFASNDCDQHARPYDELHHYLRGIARERPHLGCCARPHRVQAGARRPSTPAHQRALLAHERGPSRAWRDERSWLGRELARPLGYESRANTAVQQLLQQPTAARSIRSAVMATTPGAWVRTATFTTGDAVARYQGSRRPWRNRDPHFQNWLIFNREIRSNVDIESGMRRIS